MKLFDGGLVIIIILAVLSAYSAGVYNWAAHCEQGGLDPPGCAKQTQTK